MICVRESRERQGERPAFWQVFGAALAIGSHSPLYSNYNRPAQRHKRKVGGGAGWFGRIAWQGREQVDSIDRSVQNLQSVTD